MATLPISELEQRVRDRVRNTQHNKIANALEQLLERFPERDRPGVGRTRMLLYPSGSVIVDDGRLLPEGALRLAIDSGIALQMLEIALLRETEGAQVRKAIDKLVTTLLTEEARTHG